MSILPHTAECTCDGLGPSMQSDVYGEQPDQNGDAGYEELLLLEPRTKLKRPPLYKVVMLNDDYTPMDFVVEILKTVFRQPHEDAISTMLKIHRNGSGLCGVFTRDVAETKIDMAIACAKKQEYPLHCVMEQE